MSKADGMAALWLEKPAKIPRTEYSAHCHWNLIRAVTGTDVTCESSEKQQKFASSAFVKAWDYGFMWNIWVHSHNALEGFYTKMGHAAYAEGGTDFSKEVSCPFKEIDDVLNFRPTEKYRAPDKSAVLAAIETDLKTNEMLYPDCVNMTGCYISCFSGLIEMFGWEMLLLAAGADPKALGEVTENYGKFILQYFEILARSSSDVIMIHDDLCWTSGPVFAPEWYRKYVFPVLRQEIALLKDCGKKVLFTCDGNYSAFIDDVARCGADGFVMEPSTNMRDVAEHYGKTHVIVGNADTRILLSGTKEDIENEVRRCVDIGKDCPGYFLAVGNHIPSNTPVDNALWYNEMYEKYARR